MRAIIKKPIILNVKYVEDITDADKDNIITFKNEKECIIGRLGLWYYWYYKDSDYYTIVDETIRGCSVRDLVERTLMPGAKGFSGVFIK